LGEKLREREKRIGERVREKEEKNCGGEEGASLHLYSFFF